MAPPLNCASHLRYEADGGIVTVDIRLLECEFFRGAEIEQFFEFRQRFPAGLVAVNMQSAFRTAQSGRNQFKTVRFHGNGVQSGDIEQFIFRETRQLLVGTETAALFKPVRIILRKSDNFKKFRKLAQSEHFVCRVIVSNADLCNPDSPFHHCLL